MYMYVKYGSSSIIYEIQPAHILSQPMSLKIISFNVLNLRKISQVNYNFCRICTMHLYILASTYICVFISIFLYIITTRSYT